VHPHTATYRKAQILASLLGRAPTLPHVTWLQTLPSCSGGLRYYHVSHASGSRLPTEGWEGPGLPCVTWLWTPPPCLGGLWCCHAPHGSGPCLPARGGHQHCYMSCDHLRVAGLKNKERHSCNGMQQGSRVSKTHTRVTEVPDRHASIRHYHDL
jgi:hypothetical protein